MKPGVSVAALAPTTIPLATHPFVFADETGFDGSEFESVATWPAGVSTFVSGVSAEKDQALPHGPAIV